MYDKPLPVWVMLDARQDKAHIETGIRRPFKSKRSESKLPIAKGEAKCPGCKKEMLDAFSDCYVLCSCGIRYYYKK